MNERLLSGDPCVTIAIIIMRAHRSVTNRDWHRCISRRIREQRRPTWRTCLRDNHLHFVGYRRRFAVIKMIAADCAIALARAACVTETVVYLLPSSLTRGRYCVMTITDAPRLLRFPGLAYEFDAFVPNEAFVHTSQKRLCIVGIASVKICRARRQSLVNNENIYTFIRTTHLRIEREIILIKHQKKKKKEKREKKEDRDNLYEKFCLQYRNICRCENWFQIISVAALDSPGIRTIDDIRRKRVGSQPPITSSRCYFHRFLSILIAITCVRVCVIGSTLTYDHSDSLDVDSTPELSH